MRQQRTYWWLRRAPSAGVGAKEGHRVWPAEAIGCSMRQMSMVRGLIALPLAVLATACTGSSGPSLYVLPTSSPRPFSGATPIVPTGPSAISPEVAPSPAPTLDIADKQSVVLTHCGILHIRYQGQEWEVLRPPFYRGSTVPDTFTGFGSFARDGEALMYTDERGATLRFTVNDGQEATVGCA